MLDFSSIFLSHLHYIIKALRTTVRLRYDRSPNDVCRQNYFSSSQNAKPHEEKLGIYFAGYHSKPRPFPE